MFVENPEHPPGQWRSLLRARVQGLPCLKSSPRDPSPSPPRTRGLSERGSCGPPRAPLAEPPQARACSISCSKPRPTSHVASFFENTIALSPRQASRSAKSERWFKAFLLPLSLDLLFVGPEKHADEYCPEVSASSSSALAARNAGTCQRRGSRTKAAVDTLRKSTPQTILNSKSL